MEDHAMTPPRFAVMGHPNEGKSSVVSTLTENERVRISRVPGETTRCKRFAVRLNDEPVLEIVDTPGFQNPSPTLEWFENYSGDESRMVQAFIEAHREDPAFHHDLELLEPLTRRAAILYVADSSRPLREKDRKEMELLRLTGLPRMALLNQKRQNHSHEAEWREALNRRFNLVRPFNAHHASFPERVDLLDALALMVPEHEKRLRDIRDHLVRDWRERLEQSARVLEESLRQALTLRVRLPVRPDQDEAEQEAEALRTYRTRVHAVETRARKHWRHLFHHQTLPDPGEDAELLDLDPFTGKVWRLLGLSRRQIAGAGATAGATLGAGVDVAAGGLTFGVFAAGGAMLGGLGGWMGGPKLGAKHLPLAGRHTLAKEYIQIGPHEDPTLAFVLIDRAFIYLFRLMNWAHARRDHQAFLDGLSSGTRRSRDWTPAERKQLAKWVQSFFKDDPAPEHTDAVHHLFLDRLHSASLATDPDEAP